MTSEHQIEKADFSTAGKPVRVLIVDDVKSARNLLREILDTDPRFLVVGDVDDGLEAVAAAQRLKPDLITMDIRLPGIDGFEAVERILETCQVPIVMITASMDNQEEKLFHAFKVGALDVLDKQELYLWRTRPDVRNGFLRRLRTLSSTRVMPGLARTTPEPEILVPVERMLRGPRQPPLVVAIAASTGGPSALMRLLRLIPRRVNGAFVVVQHMSKGFLGGLVRWLDEEVELRVRKARQGDLLEPGVVLVAPGDYHLTVTDGGTVHLSSSLPINGHRPSAELLFESVANHYGKQGAGVILTGMGADGAAGLKSLKLCGGHTIAQDEHTSIIFGMPSAAIELGAAEAILPLEEIGPQIMRWISEQQDRENEVP